VSPESNLIYHKKRECREGESLSARGLRGCPPETPKTPLGRAGGKKDVHVAARTPTLFPSGQSSEK